MAYTFLIVDDSLIVRKMIRKAISLSEVEVNEVLEAENGQEALDLLDGAWIDLVFLDINMPVMNGMEFIENLRHREHGSEIPVVVVSTEGSQERQDQMAAKEIKAFLRKPVTPEQLKRTVRTVLEGEVA